MIWIQLWKLNGHVCRPLYGSNAKDDGEKLIDIGLIKTMGKGMHPMNEVGAFDE